MVIEAEIISHHLSLMIDTGAEINLLAESSLTALRQDSYLAFPIQHAQVNIHGADSKIFQSSGVVTLAIRFFPRSKPIPVAFHVFPDFALLRFPTLRSLHMDIYPKDRYLTISLLHNDY